MIILLTILMGIPADTGNPMMWVENQQPAVVRPVVPLNATDPPVIFQMDRTYWICREDSCAPVIPLNTAPVDR